MCKSVFSFLRQLTTWHYSHPAAAARLLLTAGRTSIDRSPDPQQQTRSRGVRRPDETYGRTDRRRTYARPLHRLCSEYDAGCANEGNYSIISSRPTSVLRILYCVRKYPTCFIFFYLQCQFVFCVTLWSLQAIKQSWFTVQITV